VPAPQLVPRPRVGFLLVAEATFAVVDTLTCSPALLPLCFSLVMPALLLPYVPSCFWADHRAFTDDEATQ